MLLVVQLVDSCLVKIWAEDPAYTSAIVSMLENEPHDCDVDELVLPLERLSLHWYLSQLYLAHGRMEEVLKIWTEYVFQSAFVGIH